jgi:predicted RNase H-like nuclease (RuvC/YqgF family)
VKQVEEERRLVVEKKEKEMGFVLDKRERELKFVNEQYETLTAQLREQVAIKDAELSQLRSHFDSLDVQLQTMQTLATRYEEAQARNEQLAKEGTELRESVRYLEGLLDKGAAD